MSKYRCGSHHLPVSETRYNGINDVNKCSLCNNDVGDEYHYLLVCPSLSHVRKNYVDKYYWTSPSTQKMNSLLSSTSVPKLKKIAKFMSIIMNILK